MHCDSKETNKTKYPGSGETEKFKFDLENQQRSCYIEHRERYHFGSYFKASSIHLEGILKKIRLIEFELKITTFV